MARNIFLSAATALLLAGSALAQTAGTHNPAAIESGSYAVEPAHTQLGFTVVHFGFSNFSGRLSGASGNLTISTSDPAASKLSVSVPATSFSTPSEKLNGELVGADWFDAEKFPTISFVSTKVTKTGADSVTVAGDLTMHGVTKPVTLTAHLVGVGPNPFNKKLTVGFEATGTVKRSDFGVTKYVPLISDEVTLTLSGAFEKQG